jgi:hypothetical protein
VGPTARTLVEHAIEKPRPQSWQSTVSCREGDLLIIGLPEEGGPASRSKDREDDAEELVKKSWFDCLCAYGWLG